MNPRLKKAENFKMIYEIESKNLKTWIEKVKNLEIDELVVDEPEQNGFDINYCITLPEHLIEEFQLIKSNLESVDADYFNEPIHYLLWGSDDSFDELEWSIKVNKIKNNRIDINGSGLPHNLRGLGLGKKLYHKIIKLEGYISSIDQGSYKYSDLLWLSIYKSPLFLTFTAENKILCFAKDIIPENICEILEKTFLNYDLISCSDSNFISQIKPKIIQSEILNSKSFI